MNALTLAHPAVLAILLSSCFVWCGNRGAVAQTPEEASATVEEASATVPQALTKRLAWTTSRLHGSPNPPPPYAIEPVFPKLKFHQPTVLTSAPGTDRMFVVENGGKLYSFPNDQECEEADLFFDLAGRESNLSQTYGLAFHPKFSENRYIYLCYVLKGTGPDGTRVSRFTVSTTEPPVVDPHSEKIIITWLAGGHNGCCLKFGPDGCLYISTGDGAGPNPPDVKKTGQDISDLLSSILRIDVDHPDEGKNYGIPADNPFVNVEGARGEVWAFGLRNPWKMSFDRLTGDLWAGDVGWEMWEMVYLVRRGGNYGWSITEGRQPVHPADERGPTPILPPVVDHPHSESRSITGGFVYRGQRLKELAGAYIYGDYSTGKIWGLRYDGQQVTRLEELVDTPLQIVGFAEDTSGELYLLDYGTTGQIYRLSPNSAADESRKFPRRLSETGLFDSVADHIPARGVVGYSVNGEVWSDFATAERFIALPDDSKLGLDDQVRFTFPEGTVLVKTISIEIDRGVPDSRRRLETQILHRENGTWRSYAYVWNDDQTDATLADAAGMNQMLSIVDSETPGGQRQQTWRVASRAECDLCHTAYQGSVLGVNAGQLNRLHDYDGTVDNQLRAWERMGLFNRPLAKSPEELPRLPDASDVSLPLEQRARAYLHTNCHHCHRPNGGGTTMVHLDFAIDLKQAHALGAAPTQGAFGLPQGRIVAAGAPYRSVLYYRMAKIGRGRMPHIGSRIVDEQGLALVHDWITSLPATEGAEESGGTAALAHHAAVIDTLSGDNKLSAEDRSAALGQLLSSTHGSLLLSDAIAAGKFSPSLREESIARAMARPSANIRDLFERFVPLEARKQRLGERPDTAEILALDGDVQRGRQAFFFGVASGCKNCHSVHNVGGAIGSDLSQIGKKYQPAALLETILEPSKEIDAKYRAYVLQTTDGLTITGLLVERSEKQTVLKNGEGKLIRLAADQVEKLLPSEKSLMPEFLLRDMTAQEAADLLAFLASLK